jgi:hypothetical protein
MPHAKNPIQIKICLWCRETYQVRGVNYRRFCGNEYCTQRYTKAQKHIHSLFPFGDRGNIELKKLEALGKFYVLPDRGHDD